MPSPPVGRKCAPSKEKGVRVQNSQFQESQDHRKAVCRGHLEVSPTQILLLLALDQVRHILVLSCLENFQG